MEKKIVVVGSINMDIVISAERMPKMGETILGQGVAYLPGGKGANQAVAIARLNGDVKLVGAVGDDQFGNRLLKDLTNNQVDIQYVSQVNNAATGIANIYRVNPDNCITVIPGANFKLTPACMTEEIEKGISEADVVLTQLEIPMETIQYVLEIAKSHGVKTVLNPAPAQDLSKSLLGLVDYLTPNETEFEALVGSSFSTEAELQEQMAAWQDKYEHTLIITLGEKGCAYLENGKLVVVPPPKVDAVDTTGAGDAFNGALTYGLAAGWPLSKLVSFAVAVSSKAVTKFGAQEGMPFYDELEL